MRENARQLIQQSILLGWRRGKEREMRKVQSYVDEDKSLTLVGAPRKYIRINDRRRKQTSKIVTAVELLHKLAGEHLAPRMGMVIAQNRIVPLADGPSPSFPGSVSDGKYDKHAYMEKWTDAMAYPDLQPVHLPHHHRPPASTRRRARPAL